MLVKRVQNGKAKLHGFKYEQTSNSKKIDEQDSFSMQVGLD